MTIRARKYILEHAEALGATNVRWVANEGLTPGWDIQYEDQTGQMVAVEVKGSAGPQFGNIELTAGEWNAAKTFGTRYWLFLVGNCCGAEPKLQRLQDPAGMVTNGGAQVTPVVLRFAALSEV